MSKKVLIVCYSYPPNPGVGGRKWAIFTQYLLNKGFEIHILTKKPSPGSTSPWSEYTTGAIVHYFNNPYPKILEMEPKSICDKLTYKIALLFTKIFTKSNYYDRGVFSKRIIKNAITSIIEKYSINNVIVTGAPFSFLHYAAQLKIRNASFNYAADIRDSWIKGNYFGFNGLSKKIKNREINKLKLVLKYADHVIVPYKEMQDDYSSLVNREIVHFSHAVDDSLICSRSTTANSMFTMVCFGSIYDGLSDVFEGINKSIKNTNIKIQFYTKDKKYGNLIKENVQYCEMVNQIQVFQILSQCNAALFFVNDNIKNYISTKYMEAIASRTPIVLMGKKGLVSDFITSQCLGIFIEENDIAIQFQKLPNLVKELKYNDKFNYEEYTFSYQTEKLIKLFI
jgi:hypothetical protein